MSQQRKRKRKHIHPLIKGIFSLAVIALILYLSTFAVKFCMSLFMEGDYIVQVPGQESPVVSQTLREDEEAATPTDPGVIMEVSRSTVLATGDLMAHLPIVRSGETGSSYNFDYIYSYVKPYVSAADYAVVNLETTLSGTDGKEYTGYPKFNSPDAIASGAKSGGFDMVLTANNHCYDYGTAGLKRTLEVVRAAGLDVIGTTEDSQDARYAVKDVGGIKVGMVNYTFGEFDEDSSRPAINGLPTDSAAAGLINAFDYDQLDQFYKEMENNISAMRAAGAEVIVLYIHWGDEYTTKVNSSQTAIAQKMCDLGVDIIAGSHPHVVQPIDLLTSSDGSHQTVCMYSMGNFLSNQRASNISLTTGHSEDSVLFTFTLVKYSNGQVVVESVDLLPTWVLIRGSGDSRTYHILPLDTAVENWASAYDLSSSQSEDARASYNRTTAIVGEKLTAVQTALAQKKSDLEAALGILPPGVG